MLKPLQNVGGASLGIPTNRDLTCALGLSGLNFRFNGGNPGRFSSTPCPTSSTTKCQTNSLNRSFQRCCGQIGTPTRSLQNGPIAYWSSHPLGISDGEWS